MKSINDGLLAGLPILSLNVTTQLPTQLEQLTRQLHQAKIGQLKRIKTQAPTTLRRKINVFTLHAAFSSKICLRKSH